MRSIGMFVVLAVCLGCAGSRSARQAEEQQAEEQRAEEHQQEPAPASQQGGPPAQEAPSAGGEPIEVPLPPEDDATWIAPEIRHLAESLEESEVPPSALYYVGGSIGPGCLELYTFRFFYGTRDRFADVAGFADEATAQRCEQIAAEQELPIPERIGAWLVQDSDEVAGEAAIVEALRDGVSAFTTQGATPIPRGAIPFGAQPDTFVRRRHPPPAN